MLTCEWAASGSWPRALIARVGRTFRFGSADPNRRQESSHAAAPVGAASLQRGGPSSSCHPRAHSRVLVGPPAAPVEIVPAPRVGFVWLPGYWDWRHGHHYWVAGRYVRPRPGFVYEPARWVEYGGRWRYTRPEWRAWGRDRDGVPDRHDRHPDNPYRR